MDFLQRVALFGIVVPPTEAPVGRCDGTLGSFGGPYHVASPTAGGCGELQRRRRRFDGSWTVTVWEPACVGIPLVCPSRAVR